MSGPHFVVRLKKKPRSNQAIVTVDGAYANQGSYKPNAGDLIGAFRGTVRQLREKHPGATFDLPGGIRNEWELITERMAQTLIDD